MKNVFCLAAIVVLLVLANSCSKAKYTNKVNCDEADDSLNTYSLKIASILNSNCANGGCHSSASHKDARDFSSYSSSAHDFDGTALCCINRDGVCPKMPKDADKLSDDVIHDLTCWVKNDYPQ